MPVISTSGSSGGGAGTEIGYAQVTTNKSVTDTLESTATALITLGPFTYTGVPIYLEFFTPQLSTPVGVAITMTLFEGATQLCRIASSASIGSAQVAQACMARFKLTPVAGSHTYKLCGFVASSSGTVVAGAGGTGAFAPAYLRSVIA